MIRKLLFIGSHEMVAHGFMSEYNRVVENQWESRFMLQIKQDKALSRMIHFAVEEVPYYSRLFKSLNLTPDDIRTTSDLRLLPVLTKDIIRAQPGEFVPKSISHHKYVEQVSSGSTGTPFKFRMSDYALTVALLYRGWGYGGYNLGDPMIILAGAALAVNPKQTIKKAVQEVSRNTTLLSSFDLKDNILKKYADIVIRKKPRFIRGYPSSIFLLSKYIQDHHINVPQLKGVFTTAEKLYPTQRKTIGEAFDCPVYDTYGIYDGGIGAYECSAHNGMHIDTERAVLEVIDEDGNPKENGEGRIICTTLQNFAMPLIRYDSSDLGIISDRKCTCGRESFLLTEVIGRSMDMLIAPDGTKVHGALLGLFLQESKGVLQYQIVQDTLQHLTVHIIPEPTFDSNAIQKGINDLAKARGLGWDISLELVDKIGKTSSGKYRLVISHIL